MQVDLCHNLRLDRDIENVHNMDEKDTQWQQSQLDTPLPVVLAVNRYRPGPKQTTVALRCSALDVRQRDRAR